MKIGGVILFWLISSFDLVAQNQGNHPYQKNQIGLYLFLVLAFLYGIYISIKSIMLFYKRKKAKRLLNDFARQDLAWDPIMMKERIQKVFFEVQKAWVERNQDLAREFMSDKMFEEQKLKTDFLINSGRKNILESIRLDETSIISVTDFKENSKDKFSAHIKGRMINYIINDRTLKVTSGDNKHYTPFEEVWHFIRIGNKWVFNEIDQNITIYDLIDNSEEESSTTSS